MFTTPHHDIGYHFELSDDEEKFDEGIIQCLNSEIVKLDFCNKVENLKIIRNFIRSSIDSHIKLMLLRSGNQ